MPSWLALGFQDTGSPFMLELLVLHDHIMVIMLLVVFLVSYIMLFLLYTSFYHKYLTEGTLIETIWSVIPAFLLLVLVVPSMKVLYFMEDVKSPAVTVKVLGHQWYWSYIVPFYKNLSFLVGSTYIDYYTIDCLPVSDSPSEPRLLSCSNTLFLPVGVTTRFLISSTDVVHAFSMPSLGLKVDAVPGRINQLYATPSRVGVYFGQCSEICGSNHSFMPIELSVVSSADYLSLGKEHVINTIMDLTMKNSCLSDL